MIITITNTIYVHPGRGKSYQANNSKVSDPAIYSYPQLTSSQSPPSVRASHHW